MLQASVIVGKLNIGSFKFLLVDLKEVLRKALQHPERHSGSSRQRRQRKDRTALGSASRGLKTHAVLMTFTVAYQIHTGTIGKPPEPGSRGDECAVQ